MANIVIFEAHPDDLTCMAGTATLLGRKHQLHVITATRGQRGREDWTMERTAEVRTAEAEAACRRLGATLTWLERIDGELFADREVCLRAAELVKQIAPAAVFTLWPLDEHPDHSAISEISRKAMHLSGHRAELLYYPASMASQTLRFEPDLYVDISDVWQQKMDVVRCYPCQNRDGGLEQMFEQQCTFGGQLSRCRYAEGFRAHRPLMAHRPSVLAGL